MALSGITGYTPIPNNSAATTGLFDRRYQALQDNLNSLWTSANSISVGQFSTNTLSPASGNSISAATVAVTARSIDSGGQYFNCLAFGCDPTGVADSTQSFQLFLNAVGGGVGSGASFGASTSITTVSPGYTDGTLPPNGNSARGYISAGTYRMTGMLYFPAHVVIEGAGRSSVLYHAGNVALINFVRPGTLDGYNTACVLRDFMVYGNLGGTSQHGVYAQYCHSTKFENFEVKNCGGRGLWVNDHTIGMQFNDVKSSDNSAEQLFLDGIQGSTYQNCDTHVINKGNYFCNSRGSVSVRLRRTADTAIFHPIIEGSTTANNVGLLLEGAETVQAFHAWLEGHGTHLSVSSCTVDGHRANNNRIVGGDWQGGNQTHIGLTISGSDGIVLDDPHINAWQGNTLNVMTVASDAFDTTVLGDLGGIGLSDSGVNTRIVPKSLRLDAQSGPLGSTNLLKNSCNLAGTGWAVGSGYSVISGWTGPFPGITASRCLATSASNNNVAQASASSSSGNYHSLSFWAKGDSATSGHAKITVPGVADVIDQSFTVGTSYRRYFVRGGLSTVSGLANAQFSQNSGVTIYVAGVKLELGSPSPYVHTGSSVVTIQQGDEHLYGQHIAIQDSLAAAPPFTFASESSLGFYRSGVSTLAPSYGTLNLATNAVRLSMRTLAASAITASAAKTNVAVDEVVFTIGGASGASFGIMSGGTFYYFNSAGSAKAT